MSKFLRLQATAARLIRENGARYPVRRVFTGSKDLVEGTVSNPEPLNQQVHAVVLPPSSSTRTSPVEQFINNQGGVLTLGKINNVIISPLVTWALQPLDQIYYEDRWWTLEYVAPLKPNGSTVVLYKGFIRRD